MVPRSLRSDSNEHRSQVTSYHVDTHIKYTIPKPLHIPLGLQLPLAFAELRFCVLMTSREVNFKFPHKGFEKAFYNISARAKWWKHIHTHHPFVLCLDNVLLGKKLCHCIKRRTGGDDSVALTKHWDPRPYWVHLGHTEDRWPRLSLRAILLPTRIYIELWSDI